MKLQSLCVCVPACVRVCVRAREIKFHLDLAKANGYCSSTSEAFYYRERDEVQQETCRRCKVVNDLWSHETDLEPKRESGVKINRCHKKCVW